jgi:4Fe-4S ferredoxin
MNAAADLPACKQPAGVVRPVIDANRCEGKADCLRVCPYDVFELRKLTDDERSALSLTARLKVWVHGGKQAFVLNGGQCHACGLCVAACPETAIRLTR